MQQKVLVSGIQSSGRLHIGNYFGAMRQNIALSNSGEFQSYIFIADYHSMTSLTDAEARRKSSFDLACAYLACGLDTSKVTLFKQSDVPEHTELAWILNTVTPMSLLEGAHSFKDKINKALQEIIGENNLENQSYKSFIEDHKNHTISQLHGILAVKSDENSLIGDFADHYNLKISEVRFLLQALINVKEIVSEKANVGLFTYPVLMAADILMYNASVVPVGKDQIQHVEMTREIAGKFNRAYNTELFTTPKEYVMPEVAIVPGTDGQKMSKSYGNVIPLFGTDEEIKKAVMGIVTDSAAPADKKNPDENNIYKIHKLFLSEEEDKALRARYEEGGYGYKDAKEALLASILAFIGPMREKYEYYQNNPDEVHAILKAGGEKARVRAQEMMKNVKEVVGLN